MEREFLQEHVVTRKVGLIQTESRFSLDIGKIFVTVRVERRCNSFLREAVGCTVPGVAHGQIGWDAEQPGLVEGVSVHGRGV